MLNVELSDVMAVLDCIPELTDGSSDETSVDAVVNSVLEVSAEEDIAVLDEAATTLDASVVRVDSVEKAGPAEEGTPEVETDPVAFDDANTWLDDRGELWVEAEDSSSAEDEANARDVLPVFSAIAVDNELVSSADVSCILDEAAADVKDED